MNKKQHFDDMNYNSKDDDIFIEMIIKEDFTGEIYERNKKRNNEESIRKRERRDADK